MKKKLLFINGHLNTGGVEKSLVDVLRHLDYDRYEVDLLLLEGLGDYASQLPSQVNVILHSLENTYGAFVPCLLRCLKRRDWFSLRMRLIFLEQKLFGMHRLSDAKKMLTGNKHYDCVIGFRSGVCTQVASFAVDADRRIAWWHHGEVNVTDTYLREVSNCQAIAVVSESCKQMLIAHFPALEEKLVVVSNMIDAEGIKEKAAQFEPYAGKTGVQIISVGRLAPEKHFENAIYAASQLKVKGIVFQWHLVGDGVMRPMLEQRIRELGGEDSFILEGNQANPYPYMKYADLFVHPSYVESQGIVVLEALALGVPCVVTKSLGPCEFIVDGVNGVLAEQSDIDLAEKVYGVICTQDLMKTLQRQSGLPADYATTLVSKKVESILLG